MNRVVLHALSAVVPPEIITSGAIEERLSPLYARLKLPAGRLELMSGIRERRLFPKGTLPSQAAALAAEKLFTQCDFPKAKIGALIFCSVCRDCLEPASAAAVHARLGLDERCQVFDLTNACLGMFSGLVTAEAFIRSGLTDAVLLVSGEISNAVLDSTLDNLNANTALTRQTIKPMFATLTLGSGAAAWLVTAERYGGHKLIGHATRSHTRFNGLCRGHAANGSATAEDTLMRTDSEALLRRGIETALETWNDFKNTLSWNEDTPDSVITHQVGSAHEHLLFETLGLNPKKAFSIFETFGNSGSAAAPTALALADENGVLRSGDKLALLGIGSGIHCTMTGWEW